MTNTKGKCGVGNCNCEEGRYGWIDLYYGTRPHARLARTFFCKDHWKTIMAYVKVKEEQKQKDFAAKGGQGTIHFAAISVSMAEDAINGVKP